MGIQQLIHSLHEQGKTDWAILQVDFSNAFNSLIRVRLLNSVKERCAQALPWFATCYSKHTPLYCKEEVIWSKKGIQQGDPCGPAGFCWGVHDICEALEDKVEWQSWYLDDAHLVGTPEQLHMAFQVLGQMAEERGLAVNLGKCRLWGPAFSKGMPIAIPQNSALRHTPVIPWGPKSGIQVLGIPVCFPTDNDFANSIWEKREAKVKQATNVLDCFPQSHIQCTILRYCLTACKVNDLLRACPITAAESVCARISNHVWRSFEQIVGSPLSDLHKV